MSPATDESTDRPISTLPDGLWSQPAVDTSAIDGLDDVEAVALIRAEAKLTYSYTPGTARSNFLRGMAEKRLMGERDPESDTVYTPPTACSSCAASGFTNRRDSKSTPGDRS